MANEYEGAVDDGSSIVFRARDLEEKQRIIKDRIVIIGKNLIDFREDTNKKILEIKRDLEKLKIDFERIKSFIESISSDFSKFAKKDDIEILSRQIKMLSFFEK